MADSMTSGFSVPIRLESYRLVEWIGGGMGHVWRAVHEPTGRSVAIKVAPPYDDAYAEAFRDEIRTCAALCHPNLAPVLDLVRVDDAAERDTAGLLRSGRLALVTDWVPGAPMSAILGRCDWIELRGVLVGLLSALDHAHTLGVLHRDVTPSNILLSDGRPCLIDFGSAVGARASGTPAYLAPERSFPALGNEGPHTDLYAVGCVAFAAVTRCPPFGEGSREVLAARHLREPPPRIGWGPAGFDAWVGWLLEKHPVDRPNTAAVALDALRSLGARAAHRTVTLDPDPAVAARA
jgi:serine/threonine protein kinase